MQLLKIHAQKYAKYELSSAKKVAQQQQELIDWRRGQVIQLISKGKNLTQTAEILKVDVSTRSAVTIIT
jgi:hypothetical protein